MIEPAIGHLFAALLNADDVVDLLDCHPVCQADHGNTARELRELHQLISGAYRWARNNRWTSLNPTADVNLQDVGR